MNKNIQGDFFRSMRFEENNIKKMIFEREIVLDKILWIKNNNIHNIKYNNT